MTERALDRVHDTEREVTGTMKAVEAEVPGAHLVGLAHCLKGAERFKEKVAGGLALKHERSVGKVVNAIPDALRYTCQLPADEYLDGYRMACRQLQEHGYRWVFSRNSWENLDYKGVNTRWRAPSGQIFEVQFHTAESFEAKELTHDAYKRLRDTSTNRREMGELQQFQREVSARIQVPNRVNEIEGFRERGG